MNGTIAQPDVAALAANPLAFIHALTIPSAGGPRPMGAVVAPFQSADFAAMAPALLALASGERPPTPRFWLERTKGASKDTDLAACLLWLLAFSPRALTIQVGAADQAQADELRKAARDILRLNPWLGQVVTVQALSLVNPHTESRADILTADAAGSHGARPDLLVLNELTHVGKREFAETLLDNASKMPDGVVIIATNAGHVDTWQEQWRQTAIDSDRWHFSAYSQPAPWLDAGELAEARRRNSPNRFARLWQGQWLPHSGDALDATDLDACIDAALEPWTKPRAGWDITAGLDGSTRRDDTSIVLVARHTGFSRVRTVRRKRRMHPTLAIAADLGMLASDDPDDDDDDFGPYEYRPRECGERGTGRLVVARVKVWKPVAGRIDLGAVEDYVLRLHRRFKLAAVAVDPHQMEHVGQRLERRGVPIRMIPPTLGALQQQASMLLEAIGDRTISILPDSRLVADLRRLRVVERGLGFRLESPRTNDGIGTAHGDAASALCLALQASKEFSEPQSDGFAWGTLGDGNLAF
jgi:hypothetical protein